MIRTCGRIRMRRCTSRSCRNAQRDASGTSRLWFCVLTVCAERICAHSMALRFDYEPECEYRAEVRRQHLCRPPGCRGRRGPPGAAGIHNPVFVNIPPSGAPCFFDVRGDLCLYILQQLTKEQLVSVLPLQLNRLESQEVVVYMYAAVALDRILSMRTGGPITLMYACLIPVESPSSSNLQVLIRGRITVRASAPQRPPCQDRRPTKPGVHGGGELPYALCVRPFASGVLVPDQLSFPDVARVIITAKKALIGEYVTVLQRLVDILRKVAPKPK